MRGGMPRMTSSGVSRREPGAVSSASVSARLIRGQPKGSSKASITRLSRPDEPYGRTRPRSRSEPWRSGDAWGAIPKEADMAEEQPPPLSEEEEREVEERSPPKAKVVHAAVVKQGEDELERPTGSLFWSGFAAGIAMIASVSAQGALHQRLPDAPWRELVAGFGYTLGFIIVILGRMQLFTEHTTVAVLPLMRERTMSNLGRTARLWGIVFSG